MKFVLASGSPRRKELLSEIIPSFDIAVSEADEESVPKTLAPELYVEELALLKAAASSKTLDKKKSYIVIGADTVVTLDGEILGKPADESDAFNMLKRLSGRKHEVYTGYCVMRLEDGFTLSKAEKTEVFFKELDDERIRTYVKTGEPMDKAGAYGIQGLGKVLINKINGDYNNVVGLPVSALFDVLEKEFDIRLL
ncbi:MAG: Maf family protein [bacterium]|nr:Maf family protein [bacterium]